MAQVGSEFNDSLTKPYIKYICIQKHDTQGVSSLHIHANTNTVNVRMQVSHDTLAEKNNRMQLQLTGVWTAFTGVCKTLILR